jgi:hypothetical protein
MSADFRIACAVIGRMHMQYADRSTHQKIAWLRHCSAVIRGAPPLWPFWWPVLCVWEAEATWLEQRVAHRPDRPSDTICGKVIDLAEWQRRKAAARPWHLQRAGDAA